MEHGRCCEESVFWGKEGVSMMKTQADEDGGIIGGVLDVMTLDTRE